MFPRFRRNSIFAVAVLFALRWPTHYKNWQPVDVAEEIIYPLPYLIADKNDYRYSTDVSINVMARYEPEFIGDWAQVGSSISYGPAYSLDNNKHLWQLILKPDSILASALLNQPLSVYWKEVWAKCKPAGVSDIHKEEYYLTDISATAVYGRQRYKCDAYGMLGYQGQVQKYFQYCKTVKYHARPVSLLPMPPPNH